MIEDKTEQLSRGTVILIKSAITNLPQDKRYKVDYLSDEVSNILKERYGENSTRYNYMINRLGMENPQRVREKIQYYLARLVK